jgi:hypothetical protein
VDVICNSGPYRFFRVFFPSSAFFFSLLLSESPRNCHSHLCLSVFSPYVDWFLYALHFPVYICKRLDSPLPCIHWLAFRFPSRSALTVMGRNAHTCLFFVGSLLFGTGCFSAIHMDAQAGAFCQQWSVGYCLMWSGGYFLG